MTKHPNRLWIIALLLGWSLDFLFWQKPAGINFAIFVVLCLAAGLALLLRAGIKPARNSLWLLVPLAFFAAITFIRREPMTAFLAYTLTLFALSLFTITYLGGRWIWYSLADYLARFFDLTIGMLSRPVGFNQEIHKLEQESGVQKKPTRFWAVLRGLLIALPVVAIFASLLASADVVFSQQLDKVIQLFRLENLPEYIFRSIYILVAAYLLAGVFLYAAGKSREEKLFSDGKPFISQFLGFTEAAIVLGSVAVLFLAFVVIQFQYFFGGNANIHIDGYTYSEYARRGFGELVTVAFFTLLLLLGLGGITRREGELSRRVFSGLGIGLVVMVLVMLVSAYQRLALYESAYGFSRLRTYTHVFLYWIAFLLVATIVLEILRRERWFAFFAVLASFGFAASLALMNVDAFIVRQNIARELSGQPAPDSQSAPGSRGERVELDTNYFLTLSDDAVPALVQAYQSGSLPDDIENRLAGSLACIRNARKPGDEKLPWQGFHLSSFFADQALARIDQDLNEYKIQEKDWPPVVVDSQGNEVPCFSNYMD